MTDFLKIAKSIVVHFAHICAYGVETVKHKNILFHVTCPFILCKVKYISTVLKLSS